MDGININLFDFLVTVWRYHDRVIMFALSRAPLKSTSFWQLPFIISGFIRLTLTLLLRFLDYFRDGPLWLLGSQWLNESWWARWLIFPLTLHTQTLDLHDFLVIDCFQLWWRTQTWLSWTLLVFWRAAHKSQTYIFGINDRISLRQTHVRLPYGGLTSLNHSRLWWILEWLSSLSWT